MFVVLSHSVRCTDKLHLATRVWSHFSTERNCFSAALNTWRVTCTRRSQKHVWLSRQCPVFRICTKIGLYRQILISFPWPNSTEIREFLDITCRLTGRYGEAVGHIFWQLFLPSSQEDIICRVAVGGVKVICGKVMMSPNSVPDLTRLNVTWVRFITDLQQLDK
jgi:hypothetical protein